MSQQVTYVEAAEILGCHLSNIAKLIRKGELTSTRRRKGALLRAEVETLAERRRMAREQLVPRPRTRRPIDRWPDQDHVWLQPNQVATLLDVTSQAVTARLRRGTLPGVARGRRWWVRQDQLERVVDARLASLTRRP